VLLGTEDWGGKEMTENHSFAETAIVACGTMRPELEYLRNSGFLDARKVYYTTPGLHQTPAELAEQLKRQLQRAKEIAAKVIVVYGGKFCYINVLDPYQTMDTIIDGEREAGVHISRINAERCFDMLASEAEREKISGGEKVWWLTPGWIIYQRLVFKGWDKAQANENFPKHTGGAILLDGINFFDQYSLEHTEELLEFSDWMGLPIQPYQVSLDRFKSLLLEQLN